LLTLIGWLGEHRNRILWLMALVAVLALGLGGCTVLARASAEMDWFGVYQAGCCSDGYDPQTQSMQHVQVMPQQFVEDLSRYHTAIVDELTARYFFGLFRRACYTDEAAVCQLVDQLEPWIKRYAR
jgi:hypothetical protein